MGKKQEVIRVATDDLHSLAATVDAEIRQRISKIRDQGTLLVYERMRGIVVKALEVMEEGLEDPDPNIRLRAATRIIDTFDKKTPAVIMPVMPGAVTFNSHLGLPPPPPPTGPPVAVPTTAVQKAGAVGNVREPRPNEQPRFPSSGEIPIPKV